MNVRGILPSLGAGGSLTAAVFCAAAIVGGGLAFRGEAGGSAEANTGDVKVPAATDHARTASARPARTGPAVATVARRTRTRTATAAAPRRRTTRATVRRNATAPRAGLTPRAPTPATAPAPATAPKPRTPAPASGGRPAPTPSLPTPAIPAGTVTQTVQQVRQVAKPVVDLVPEPAQGRVQTVTDAVEQVTGVVDQTVDGLTGGLLP
jgi:hypothetical protein